MNRKKNSIYINRFWLFQYLLLFVIFLLFSTAHGKDLANFGLIGRWRYKGSITCTRIFEFTPGKTYSYCGTTEGLLIVDVTDPNIPHEISFLEIGHVHDIVFFKPGSGSDKYAVMANGENGLSIFNISNPAKPVYTGKLDTPDAWGLSISGRYAYVADRFYGLMVIDISDPSQPRYSGGLYECGLYGGLYSESYKCGLFKLGEALKVDISGGYAFVANRYGLVAVDISDPTKPAYSGIAITSGDCLDVAISGKYAYVADGCAGLVSIDITDPTHPKDPKTLDSDTALGVTISGDYTYAANGDKGVRIFDITDQNSPVYAGGYDTSGYSYDIAISGGYAYVADWDNGLIVIDLTGLKEASRLDESGNAVQVTIDGNNAYIADKDNGLIIVDITDTTNPGYIGGFDKLGEARYALVLGNYAYIADGLKRLVILDISDPNVPSYVSEYNELGYANSITITVSDGHTYAYIADGSKGLVILDVSDPNAPSYVDEYNIGPARSAAISENLAYIACGAKGLVVMEMITPTQFKFGKILNVSKSAYDVAISGNYAYIADGLFGLVIIRISDILNPVLPGYVNTLETPGEALNVTISGRYAYVADGLNGLVAFDITNPTQPVYAGGFRKSKDARDIAVRGEYVYMVDGPYGFYVLKIFDTPQSEGNLIICTSGPASADNNLWYPSQNLANMAYSAFLKQNYPHYFTYYLNPNPYQDIDFDGILDPLAVDEIAPSVDDLNKSITFWAYNRVNTGPLYLYITGQGTKDLYQICPGETLKVSDMYNPFNPDTLKYSLDLFQRETGRDVICILEFSSSGSFCDNLIDPLNTLPYTRTVISCTDEGTSFLDQEGKLSFTGQFLALLKASENIGIFENKEISSKKRVELLQGIFSQARENFWLSGYPFNTQPPQMVTTRAPDTLCSITLFIDPNLSSIPDPNQPIIKGEEQEIYLTAIGRYIHVDQPLKSNQIWFHSSDESILVVDQQGRAYANPDTNYNGKACIFATIIDSKFAQSPGYDPNTAPPLGGITGRIPIRVDIKGRKEKQELPKAIIVAGKYNDPSGYDYMWESTNRMANHAYHAFIDRGYSPENICCLSHDPNQTGVDGPKNDEDIYEILEGIFTDPNNAYLDLEGLTDLTIFLIDHGKENKFILGPEEKNHISPLLISTWLDKVQMEYPDAIITVIVEACYSGCFADPLILGAENRIVITSTQDTTAYLAANGWVSFSYFLFNSLTSGATITEAYESAHLEIDSLSWGGIQDPVLKDTQNGNLASSSLLGGSFILSQDQPYFIRVAELDDPNEPVNINSPVEFWARVTDLDGIRRVWAVISASQSGLHFSGSIDDPVVGMPAIDLVYDPNTGTYRNTYQGFTYPGPYTIMYLAQDTKGMVSHPKTVHLNVKGYKNDMAFLIYDPNFTEYAEFARWVLAKRRFPSPYIRDIKTEDLYQELASIAQDHTNPLDHLLLYFITKNTFDPNSINMQLDRIQQDTNCTLFILMDVDYSGDYIKYLCGENGQKRIIITSTDTNQPAALTRYPYSQFFFSNIYNGTDINQSFHSASLAIRYLSDQNPLLEDNGNCQAMDYGPDYDGKFASDCYLGSPFEPITAGPKLTIPSAVHINSRQTSKATIWAKVQDPNSCLRAIIITPEGLQDRIDLDFYDLNKKRFEAEYVGFTIPGIYKVVVYVQGPEMLLDYDESPYIVIEPDSFETDNTFGQAKPIMINYIPQVHNFHEPNDVDCVYFYCYEGLPYQVTIKRVWTDCQIRIEVFDPDGNIIDTSPYAAGFSASQNGFYYAKVSYTCQVLPATCPVYELSVLSISAGTLFSGIYGWVMDSQTGNGIAGADVCVHTSLASYCDKSMQEWWSNDPNCGIGCIKKGFFIITSLSGNTEGVLDVNASGYKNKTLDIIVPKNNMIKVNLELEKDIGPIPIDPPIDTNQLSKKVEYINVIISKVEQSEESESLNLLDVQLHNGLNLFSYPLNAPESYFVYDFICAHDPDWRENGPSYFSGIRWYNKNNGIRDTFYFVHSTENNWSLISSDLQKPMGFIIKSGEGYAIYMYDEKDISFSFPPPGLSITLNEGLNWVGITNPPPAYTSYKMIQGIGTREEIRNICGFNPIKGKWGNTYWLFNKPSGEEFPILSGMGYMVFMEKEKNWNEY